jgi:hypothetical protein
VVMIQCQKKKIKNNFIYARLNNLDINETVTSPWFNVLT